MPIQLDAVEARALGSLVEKSLTTREQYPLTFNSLLNACNQKTSRDPVMELDTEKLGAAVKTLIEKGLAERLQAPGDRVPKFRHNVRTLLNSDDPKLIGAMTVLLLRGPQTPGEIKGRTERLCTFESTAEAEALLRGLASREEDSLVALLPRQPGQKEARYSHLLSGAPAASSLTPAAQAAAPAGAAPQLPAGDERFIQLEKRVESLETALKTLEERFAKPA
jgi:hypothetical protein